MRSGIGLKLSSGDRRLLFGQAESLRQKYTTAYDFLQVGDVRTKRLEILRVFRKAEINSATPVRRVNRVVLVG